MSDGRLSRPSEPPRSKRPAVGPPPIRVILLYIVATLVFAGVWGTFMGGMTTRKVSYTEFKQMVRGDKVAEVVISQDRIRGTLKEADQAFAVVRVDDPGLVEELDRHAITVTGETANNWWGSLLGWLLPLGFLVLFWSLTLRQASPGQGAMAFGRSRAKIYAEDDVKVTFADVAGIDEATEELREIVDFLRNPKKYTSLGGRIPKGVLLLGPPGTGQQRTCRFSA